MSQQRTVTIIATRTRTKSVDLEHQQHIMMIFDDRLYGVLHGLYASTLLLFVQATMPLSVSNARC